VNHIWIIPLDFGHIWPGTGYKGYKTRENAQVLAVKKITYIARL
jgi:hypothetical protein